MLDSKNFFYGGYGQHQKRLIDTAIRRHPPRKTGKVRRYSDAAFKFDEVNLNNFLEAEPNLLGNLFGMMKRCTEKQLLC